MKQEEIVNEIRQMSEKDDAKVSLDYDHKITDLESAKDIVPHIIKSLDFAVRFLKRTVRANQ